MAGPCVADTNCIALSVNGLGELEATPILSPDAGNAIECRLNGLYVPSQGGVITTADTAASAPFSVTAVAPAENTVQSGSFTVTNPSATNSARYLIIADVGTVHFTTPPTNIPSCLDYSRIVPNPFVLQHQYGISNQVGVAYEQVDSMAPIFFAGTLAPSAGVTAQVQRRVQRLGVGGIVGTVGRIRWTGLVMPA